MMIFGGVGQEGQMGVGAGGLAGSQMGQGSGGQKDQMAGEGSHHNINDSPKWNSSLLDFLFFCSNLLLSCIFANTYW